MTTPCRVSTAVTDLTCPNCGHTTLVMAIEDVQTVDGWAEHWALRCSTCQLQITHPSRGQLRDIWTRLQRAWPEATAGKPTHEEPRP